MRARAARSSPRSWPRWASAKIENVEWAQWLSGVYGQKAYDLTVISHVEPLDFGNFARPGYYWNYDSAEFNALWAKDQRHHQAGRAQQTAGRGAAGWSPPTPWRYLYQPTWITVRTRCEGLWKDMPFAERPAAMSWQ